MADDQQQLATVELTAILGHLGRKFEIIHAKWSEDRFFEAKFRTQIQRNSEDFNALCDEWVDLFSEATNTVWAKKISNTGPKIRFRKQYQCWTQGGKEVQKELLFDARRCKGTLDVKVLTDNPLTRRKNKHIRMGLNVVVKINFTHLHKVDTAQPYSFFVHSCEPLPEPPKPVIQPNDNLPKLVAEMVQKGLNSTSSKISNCLAGSGVNNNNNNNSSSISNSIRLTQTNDIDILGQQAQAQTHAEQQQQQQQQHHQQQSVVVEHHILELQQQLPQEKSIHIDVNLVEDGKLLESDILLKPEEARLVEEKLVIDERLMQDQTHIQHLSALEQTMHLNHVLPIQGMETIKLEVQPQQLQQLTQVVMTPQFELNESLLMCQPTLMFDPSQVIPVSTLPHFVQVHNQQQHYL